jgi:hypothetical protein
MGDISSLGADIGEKHEFGIEYQPTYVDNDAGVSIGTECTFYSRDRGEEGVEWQTFTSVEDWISKYEGSGAEYFYLFDAGEWQVSSYRNDKFEPVAEVLAKVFDKEPV